MNMQREFSLPRQYEFVYDDDMTSVEVFEIRKTTGWEAEEKPESKSGWLSYPSSALIAVGVRSEVNKELVGVGFVVGNKRHGVLCDFNVRPEHQHKGVGRAILDERIRLADQMNIPFLYTDLASTNPLVRMYEALGFINSGNSYVRKNIA